MQNLVESSKNYTDARSLNYCIAHPESDVSAFPLLLSGQLVLSYATIMPSAAVQTYSYNKPSYAHCSHTSQLHGRHTLMHLNSAYSVRLSYLSRGFYLLSRNSLLWVLHWIQSLQAYISFSAASCIYFQLTIPNDRIWSLLTRAASLVMYFICAIWYCSFI